MYIVIDGIDGTGKTSLIIELSNRLRNKGFIPVTLVEPSFGKYGREVRSLIQSNNRDIEKEKDLFTRDRIDHIERTINPLLNIIKTSPQFVIIQDRGYLSYPAYQARNEEEVDILLQDHAKFTPVPDFIFILDLQPEKAIERINTNRGKTASLEKLQILKRARNIYGSMTDRVGNHVRLINAEQFISTSTDEILEIILRKRS